MATELFLVISLQYVVDTVTAGPSEQHPKSAVCFAIAWMVQHVRRSDTHTHLVTLQRYHQVLQQHPIFNVTAINETQYSRSNFSLEIKQFLNCSQDTH